MATISDILNKQLNCIQREKMIEMQSLIERLENKLKAIDLLAEERQQTIKRFESEKSVNQSIESFRSKLKQILGLKQMPSNDEEILSEIRDYKSSTTFWIRKYNELRLDLELVLEKLEISEFGHKIEETEDEILEKVKTFVKRIQSLKSENIRLRQQLRQNESYCQTLIGLRDNLNLEIDSLKEEKLRITTERDSLKDKCFWQNSLIKVFEDNKKDNLRPIDDLNSELKTNAINGFNSVHNFETPDKSKSFREVFGLSSSNTKTDKYWLRSATKLSQSSHSVSPKEKRVRKVSKPVSHKKLFN